MAKSAPTHRVVHPKLYTVQPLVGMGVSTIAMPRPLYNSNHDFVMAAGIGYRVKTDFNNNTCAMYATG